MNFVWIEYELLQDTFMCIHMYFICNWCEFRMQFIWISYQFIWTSYELHMNLTRNLYRKTRVSFIWTSCDLHINFVQIALEFYMYFICSSYGTQLNFVWNNWQWLQNVYEAHMKSLSAISCKLKLYLIWAAYEVHMKPSGNLYEVHMKFIWSLHAIHGCFPVQTYREVPDQVIQSSYEIYMKFR